MIVRESSQPTNIDMLMISFCFSEQRVLVKFFAKGDTSIWIKLDNVFPFDGFESFEKMKNSVDQNRLTVKNNKIFAAVIRKIPFSVIEIRLVCPADIEKRF